MMMEIVLMVMAVVLVVQLRQAINALEEHHHQKILAQSCVVIAKIWVPMLVTTETM